MRLKLLFILLPFVISAQQKKKVLFIGNSYTYVNTLPQLFSNLALSNGDSVLVDSYAPGGYTFMNHFNDATARAKIAGTNWTHVILQAQSQEPSFSPAQVAAQTFPYAVRLDSLVHAANPCAVTVFFETWGRKNGDAGNCPFYPPICTYAGMQNRLRASYKLFADTCKALMAPVGEAWRSSITYSPTLELYQSDQSHPAVEGTFLSAAVFYEVLLQRSVLTATYNPGLASTVRTFLLQRAHETVTDSLQTWNIGRFDPDADFSLVQAGNSVSLTPASTGYNHLWKFGDGSQSSLTAPVHQYAASGTYTVEHAVSDSCRTIKEKKGVSISEVLGFNELNAAGGSVSRTLLFNNVLHLPLQSSADCKIRIVDLQGVTVWSGAACGQIQTEQWPAGMYLLIAEDVSLYEVHKLIKEVQQ